MCFISQNCKVHPVDFNSLGAEEIYVFSFFHKSYRSTEMIEQNQFCIEVIESEFTTMSQLFMYTLKRNCVYRACLT